MHSDPRSEGAMNWRQAEIKEEEEVSVMMVFR
jgi:hypothetical protein